MGVIEDVYEDLDTDVEFEEFEAAVEDKVDQMGGLADEETAAMLIAHELRDEEADTIADIEPGMNDVKFLGKVTSIGDIRTFERDEEDAEEGRVCNVDVADASGSVRVALWDDMAAAAEEQLEVGQVLRVMGRPKEGYSGLEVSADKVEPDEDAEVDVQVLDTYRVEDLSLGASDVDLVGQVLDTDSIRTFDRDDGSEGRVANLTVGDETGRVRVTLWDDKADLAEEFEAGEVVEVGDGYVRERDGDLELHVGDRGTVERVDEDVEYVPETTDIAELEIGETVDVGGASSRRIRSARSTATTARKGRSGTSASRTTPARSGSRCGATRPTVRSSWPTASSSPTWRFRTAGRTTLRPPRTGVRRSPSSTRGAIRRAAPQSSVAPRAATTATSAGQAIPDSAPSPETNRRRPPRPSPARPAERVGTAGSAAGAVDPAAPRPRQRSPRPKRSNSPGQSSRPAILSCWTTASGRRASRPTQASGSARRSRCAGRNETERSTPPTCSNRMRRERRHE